MQNDVINNIRLDINKEMQRVSVSVRKNDTKTRRLDVTLVDHGTVVSLENVSTAILMAEKPDGTQLYNDCVMVGDEIQYTITTQTINIIGEVRCQIQVTYFDGSVITSPEFVIAVYEKAVTDEAVESLNEYSAIAQLVAQAEESEENAEAAAESAQAAQTEAESAQSAAETAQNVAETAANNAEEWASRSPYIGENGNWFIYDSSQNEWVDSGISSQGEKGDKGDTGSQGNQGVGIASIDKTGTSGLIDTYTITYTDGSTDTFNVKNGADGSGGVNSFNGRTGAIMPENGDYTATMVGLGNVPNVATNDQTPTYSEESALTGLTSGEALSTAFGKIKKAISSLISHIANTSNPHSVTAAQVGLGNVDNTADANKSVSYAATSGSASSATTAHYAITAGDAGTVNGKTVEENVPSDAVFTDTTNLTQMSGTLPVGNGGTGASTAVAARANLGLGTAATKDTTTTISSGNTSIPTSGAVWSALQNASSGNIEMDTSTITSTTGKTFTVPTDNTGKPYIVAVREPANQAQELKINNKTFAYLPGNTTVVLPILPQGTNITFGRTDLTCTFYYARIK